MAIVLAALVGLILGSAANLVLVRLPRERPLFRRPRCIRCGHPLGWEVAPVVGYLLQRGRGRHCGRPIPIFFPLAELLTAVVFAVLVWRHALPLAMLYALFSLTLILSLFLDWLHHYVYYVVVLPAVGVALLGHLLRFDSRLDIRLSLLGLAAGTILFLLVEVLFHAGALGLGDVWLAGAIGAMIGFPDGLIALALGMLLAGIAGGVLLLSKRTSPGDYMPYGSYLCMGALAYLCFWTP
jgi:leader peptidase (prepilin peptidase)/N-methyltransferase